MAFHLRDLGQIFGLGGRPPPRQVPILLTKEMEVQPPLPAGASSAPSTALAPVSPFKSLQVLAPPEKPDTLGRRIPLIPLRELPSYGFQNFAGVDTVRDALAQLMNGNLRKAAELVDALQGDDRVTGVLSARLDGLLGLPLEFQTPKGLETDTRALEVKEAAQKAWTKMIPEAQLREILRWGRMLGVAVFENISLTTDISTRRVKVWHPKWLYWKFDMNRQPWSGSWQLITGEGVIDLELQDDGLVHSKTASGLEEVGRFGLYAPYGYQRPWVHGLVRPLAIPWLVRNWTIRDWARYSEVHGIPIRAIKMPMEWDQAQRERAQAEIGAIGSESVLRLLVDQDGRGFDLELIEPEAQSEEAFEKLIAKCDTSIAVAILGQNLTTEISSGGGNRAAAQVHDKVRNDIGKSDSATLSTMLHDQVWLQWTEWNYGDPELTPWPTWPMDPPVDEESLAKAFLAKAQGVAALRGTQMPFGWKDITERIDLPLEEGAVVEDYKPPAPILPPGTKPPEEEGEETDGEGKKLPGKGENDAKGKGKLTSLSRARRGAAAGQEYVDKLVDVGRDNAAKLLASDLRAVLEVVRNAKATKDGKIDGEKLKEALLKAYGDMKPDELARLLEKMTLLARLQGQVAVLEDL